jgi:transposase
MIRKQASEPVLFYGAQEIARPAARNFYLRLQTAVSNWEQLAAPFVPAFNATMGRPTDPVVYLKIFLVGYLENITYDTDLAERIADSIAIREFLGYNLTEVPPDHSSISRNRARIGEYCQPEEVLAQVVALCAEAGLVRGEEVAVDATLIPANASLSSLRSITTGKSVREHLREVKEKNRLAGETSPKEKPRVSNTEFRSTTDPEARIAQKPGTLRRMSYQATHVTDAHAGIILAADCALADGSEPEAAQPVLAAARDNLMAKGLTLGRVIADAGYDDSDFHAYVEGLEATPLTHYKSDPTLKPEGFKKASFRYEADTDCYRCPAGQRLRYTEQNRNRRRYESNPADCVTCLHRPACLGQARSRSIYRLHHEASRERTIALCHTEAGKAALRRRRHIVEPPFGHMKTYGGLGRINCRGWAKATVKVVMAAVVWNLIKLVGAVEKAIQPDRCGHGFAGLFGAWHLCQPIQNALSRMFAVMSTDRTLTLNSIFLR